VAENKGKPLVAADDPLAKSVMPFSNMPSDVSKRWLLVPAACFRSPHSKHRANIMSLLLSQQTFFQTWINPTRVSWLVFQNM
jgi:hypothetical protein